MADPLPTNPQKPNPVSESERKELEAFRAAKAREEAIEKEFVKRAQIAQGMSPEAMLREIAARQVDEEASRAKQQ